MRYETGVHHRFELEGQSFAYIGSSAAVIGLDSVARGVFEHFAGPDGGSLESFEAASNGDGEARFEAFEELVTMGALRPLGEVAPASPELPAMPYPLATLVLNVTNRCNLSCTYCYEFGEDKIATPGGTTRMTPETARDSIDLLFESSEGRRDISITFFGGETLLNFDTIREAVVYAEERAAEAQRRISFALTTNATLLDDTLIDFLVEHRFGINISIDGAQADQDRHRTFASGRGSYDVIEPRIMKLLARNKGRGRPIGARVTLTSGMADVRETFEHLTREIGFDQVGFAPVTTSSDRDYALDEAHMGGILDAFSALAEHYVSEALEGRVSGFSNIHDLVRELHQGVNKAHPCGAGLGLLGVSTEGELGLCHRFVESGDHSVGSVKDGIDHAAREEFLRDGHISKKIACHECFARPHCSGGCYHEAYVRYGDAAQPNLHYCDWIRAWTDLGLRTYARIAAGNPEFLDRHAGAAAEAMEATP